MHDRLPSVLSKDCAGQRQTNIEGQTLGDLSDVAEAASNQLNDPFHIILMLQVEDVTFGNTSIAVGDKLEAFHHGGGTIVDSGTTDTYLPAAVLKGFSQAWEAAIGEVPNVKWSS